ncbi:hypothetical protein ACQP00_48020 [Dactylosporangium sp. CS-047395]|uniref:hypothetical protein n=1 Tax=Dactylosporangium sp. CS-047395 TaxID=3239936 RepID=UPI003D92747F
MENTRSALESQPVRDGDIPLQLLLTVQDDESALAKSIRRVSDAARRNPANSVAAFNNYI